MSLSSKLCAVFSGVCLGVAFYVLMCIMAGCGERRNSEHGTENVEDRDLLRESSVSKRVSPSRIVRNSLKERMVREGFDEEGELFVAIERWDDPINVEDDDFQDKRFREFECALLHALKSCAEFMYSEWGAGETKVGRGIEEGNDAGENIGISISNYRVIASSEHYDAKSGNYGCCIAVAVDMSKDSQPKSSFKKLSGLMNEQWATVGNIKEYLAGIDVAKYVGPDSFVDKRGTRWAIGIAAEDATKSDALEVAKRRAAYAAESSFGGVLLFLESITRTISDSKSQSHVEEKLENRSQGVHSFKSCLTENELYQGVSAQSSFETEISLKPLLKVNPSNNKIVWTTKTVEDPVTKKDLIAVICAYPSNSYE